MRPGSLWAILAGVLLLVAGTLAALAWWDFRASLATKIDRAQALEAAVVRPAAAARLTSALLEHRLTLLSEAESKAITAAFARAPAREAIEGYRRAGGRADVIASAERAFAARSSADADGEVALLRAVRLLRDESARAPAPGRADPPASARRAGSRLVWAAGMAALAAACSFAAGRARAAAA